MGLDQELAQVPPDRDSILTVGVFDGVHRGHRYLISQLIKAATDTGRLAGVVTFINHPASILRADFNPRYLSDIDERIRLIQETGVDFVVPISFDRVLSMLSAREFLTHLQQNLRMRGLVCGPDFALGRNREGQVKSLISLGEAMGFSLNIVDVLVDGDQTIRSTTIRQMLAKGDVRCVSKFLGRDFVLAGIVAKGAKRGRTLGFPTANLDIPSGMAIPGNGIYATWAWISGCYYMSATSIGTSPTFGNNERAVEAFIIDYEGNLYDQEIRLEFVHRLRDEERYETVQSLKNQMHRDVDQTRTILMTSKTNVG